MEYQAGQSVVSENLKVLEIGEVKEFKKDGKILKVANIKVEMADMKKMTLVLWNTDIDYVKVGDTVVLVNGYVNEYNGDVQLTKGRNGRIDVLPKERSSEEE